MAYLQLEVCKVPTEAQASESGTVWLAKPHLNDITTAVKGVVFRARYNSWLGEHQIAMNAKIRQELKLEIGENVAVNII